MRVTQLGYLGFSVSDLSVWQCLMTEVLGLAAMPIAATGLLPLRMDERHHRLCLHAGTEDKLLYIGWQVEDEAALAALGEKLAAAGIRLREPSAEELAERKVAGLIAFEDPSGYPLELFYGPKVPVEVPFRTDRPRGGFRTGQLGLGHFLATAADVKEQEAFYTQLLGFRISDYAANGGVFLRCNKRHHSAAFHPAGSFGPTSKPQINHILLEANEFDDVGAVLDACEAKGVPIAITLGRHSNDLEVSFYLRAPALLNIEYGCWGRLIEEEEWVSQVYSRGDLWGHKRVDPADREAHRNRLNSTTGRFPWLAWPQRPNLRGWAARFCEPTDEIDKKLTNDR